MTKEYLIWLTLVNEIPLTFIIEGTDFPVIPIFSTQLMCLVPGSDCSANGFHGCRWSVQPAVRCQPSLKLSLDVSMG